MYTLVMFLFVLTAIILIAVILIQQPKSAGGGLFSGTGQSLLGTSGKTFWTKFTTILAALFMVLCLGLSVLPKLQGPTSSVADTIEKQQQAAQSQSSNPSGGSPVGTQAQPNAASMPGNSVPPKP
jgi:preprotein translocase subunit SecG